MGSRRDDYLARDPIRSNAEPAGPLLGDVLTKRPEPIRGKFKPPPEKPVIRRKGKTP